jgi:hypothetical protein
VLQASYRISKTDDWKDKKHQGEGYWIDQIAKESGLKYSNLVVTYESELIKKHLLSDRGYSDRSGVSLDPYFRLTELAFNLCHFIESYKCPDDSASQTNGT